MHKQIAGVAAGMQQPHIGASGWPVRHIVTSVESVLVFGNIFIKQGRNVDDLSFVLSFVALVLLLVLPSKIELESMILIILDHI